jgi:hypothetical protein
MRKSLRIEITQYWLRCGAQARFLKTRHFQKYKAICAALTTIKFQDLDHP